MQKKLKVSRPVKAGKYTFTCIPTFLYQDDRLGYWTLFVERDRPGNRHYWMRMSITLEMEHK